MTRLPVTAERRHSVSGPAAPGVRRGFQLQLTGEKLEKRLTSVRKQAGAEGAGAVPAIQAVSVTKVLQRWARGHSKFLSETRERGKKGSC
ncbi:hypothetical protein MHYP_G00073190 [Metynnis hypsauchen]